jgi:hypothetical protein
MDQLPTYTPAIAELLQENRLQPLGPGTPHAISRPLLDNLTIATAFAPHAVRDPDMARACVAALWLYRDFLDESHQISQEIDTPTGSYWHGILHRREPDYSNAAYWFRRVGGHPAFVQLRSAAAAIAKEPSDLDPAARFLLSQQRWDPFSFIDLCAGAMGGRNSCELLCRQIQQSEWEILFDYCFRQAVGTENS